MKRFKNILYYADAQTESSATLERAMQLAESNQARLTVVDVIEPVDTPREIMDHFHVELDEILVDQRQQALEQLVQPYLQEDSLIYTRVLTGISFIEIIRFVQSGSYDLVIKQARPPAGLGEHLFGSHDLHLLRKCPCPVLIDRPDVDGHYQQVLAAVDAAAEKSAGCDDLVMALASSLAQREDAQLDVVHAWSLPGESMFRSGRFRLPSLELEHMLEHQAETQRGKLDTLFQAHNLAVDDDHIHLVKGSPAKSIHQVAERIDADIVVMGTVGRVGIPGLFMGNTAEEVLQTAACSVLAVKPEGFESPVC